MKISINVNYELGQVDLHCLSSLCPYLFLYFCSTCSFNYGEKEMNLSYYNCTFRYLFFFSSVFASFILQVSY